ncbi:hypothetical protein N6H14_02085 [Paenibacillus sp. CC-CFT747]|nr:hypothetical protein N6H14_02085 [Paenibacillus sp. CC-CFT747]
MERFIDGQPMMVTYTTSSRNGWSYVVIQPERTVLEKVYYIKRMQYLVAGITLLIGCLISLFLAYRNARPIRRLVATITERFGTSRPEASDAFSLIHTSFARLFDRNEELQVKLQQQIPFLQASFFSRLLKGNSLARRRSKALWSLSASGYPEIPMPLPFSSFRSRTRIPAGTGMRSSAWKA